MQMPDQKEKPLPYTADHGRLRRESRPESPIGGMIQQAAAEADNRVARQRGFPPPSPAEAELIAASAHQPAQLFAQVLVADLETGEQERYRLVPHDEADLSAGRISIGSPIGRALYQEYPGAVVVVKTPGGPVPYRLLQVEI